MENIVLHVGAARGDNWEIIIGAGPNRFSELSVLHAQIANHKGWSVRVDSRHGDKDYHRKHVHISKKGIKGEYSWNDDGTRHDKHNFPNNEKSIGKAKKLAADALSVPVSSLEFITAISGGIWYKFHSDHDRFSTYVHKHRIIVVLQSESNILTVIIDG
ncbi:hypothetical protein HWU03_004149 [Vibrio parahaemolyticus]|nr:hypothetical protein [Vibrio parahaemolyticus]EJG0908724.1 hypothetical protein [Vibrio parahaemolyticus]